MASRHVLAACLWLCLGAAARAEEAGIAIGGPSPDLSAAAKPKYCSRREHLGVRGQLVDQAWVIYRRIEISSPDRVGWCACARRCEPIDELAAAYEASAYAAREASRNLSLSSDERNDLIEKSIELFGERNDAVESFNGCIDATRPPLRQRDAGATLDSLRKPIPGSCKKVELALRDEWKLWCDDFVKQWQPIAQRFRDKFRTAPDGRYWIQVPLRATKAGKLSLNGRPGFFGVSTKVRDDFAEEIAAIGIAPFPSGSRYTNWDWVTTMQVIRGGGDDHWSEAMPCPKD
jgi:hypothetical protein